MKIDRIIEEVELTIQFHYVPYTPGDRSVQSVSGYVTVEDIYHKGESILALIYFAKVVEIEKEIYEEIVESEK